LSTDNNKLNESNVIDLSQALYHTSVHDDSLNLSTQSYLDDSTLGSINQNEADITISDILTLNEAENNQINELFAKRRSESGAGSSGSSSPSIDDLISKRKVKKYAIEADSKLVAQFDEIKPKLAHQVGFLD
jgi:hypothetical protein